MKKVQPKVKQIMNNSFDIAKGFNDVNVRPEHILLSILRDKNNRVVNILKGMNVDINKLTVKLHLICKDNITPRIKKKYNILPLSKETTEIINNSEKECEKLNVEFIDLEHIILSMLNSKSDITSTLNEFDVDYNNFKKNTKELNIMAHFEDDEPESTNSNDDRKKYNKVNTKTPILDNFSKDVTASAEEGKIDPVIGRDDEIQRVAQILSRRKKNNPVLIGDPGVGKCFLSDTQVVMRNDLTGEVIKTTVEDLLKTLSNS
jgi:ATP-dependent Clp protease ATP-binding subunit ClpC